MDYEKLRNRELEHIAELLKDDKEYSKRLKDLYTRILGDLHEAIEKDINYLAKNEKLSYAEAKRIANDFDVKAFQEKAREYVRTKDFSPEANKELRRYNVALRVNRMELLEQKVNLITVDLANAEAAMLEEKLNNDWEQEIERQAGIIGMSILTVENLKKALSASLLSDLNGVTFSDRIWANQKRLRDDTTDIIRRALIQGENPKVGARKLKRNLNDLYLGKRGKGGAKFVSERLAITESARVQLLADKLSYEETGFTKYVYIAELDERTCQICEQYDGLEFDVKDMGVGSPMPPVHPLCRCSVAARYDEASVIADELIEEALKYEKHVTEDMKSLTENSSSYLEGLKYRIKSKSSTIEKIKNDSYFKKIRFEEAGKQIHDILRFTNIAADDEFADNFVDINGKLNNKGYNIVRVKNTLGDKNAIYRGVNTLVRTESGYLFELQFHTPLSYEVKEKNHVLYEKSREFNTTLDEKLKLQSKMIENSKKVIAPDNIHNIKEFDNV